MIFGHALDSCGERLDDVLCVFMPGPHSATGEDVAEIHCHGGPGISAALLEAAFAAGARLAGPGEFTRRAYLNGKMDLTQAEAVSEMINAQTREGVRLAAAKLEGGLAREVAAIRSALDALRIQVTVCVDFPDEEVELLSRPSFMDTVKECARAISRLLAAFDRARLWREGATAVLAGSVNAGKSSLLNALIGRERAIVSAQPGTTRDYIEETVNVGGMPLRVVDTAGLRQGGDMIEAEGIRRSRLMANDADLLVFMIDVTIDPSPDQIAFLMRMSALIGEGRLLLVLNKIDCLEADSPGDAHELAFARGLHLLRRVWGGRDADRDPDNICFPISAKQGTGLPELVQGIQAALRGLGGPVEAGSDIAPNLRQSGLLRQALEELHALDVALSAGHPPDILGVHLDAAAAFLEEVTGTLDNEAVLDAVFSSFCIGK